MTSLDLRRECDEVSQGLEWGDTCPPGDAQEFLRRLRFPVMTPEYMEDRRLREFCWGPHVAGFVIRVVVVDGVLFPSTVTDTLKAVYQCRMFCHTLAEQAINAHAYGWRVCDPRTKEGRDEHARAASKLRAEIQAQYPLTWPDFVFREVMHCCGTGYGACGGGGSACPEAEASLLSESVAYSDADVVVDIPLHLNLFSSLPLKDDPVLHNNKSWMTSDCLITLWWNASPGVRVLGPDKLRLCFGVRHCALNVKLFPEVTTAVMPRLVRKNVLDRPGFQAFAQGSVNLDDTFMFTFLGPESSSYGNEMTVTGRVEAVTYVSAESSRGGIPELQALTISCRDYGKVTDEFEEVVVLRGHDAVRVVLAGDMVGYIWKGPRFCSLLGTRNGSAASSSPETLTARDVLQWMHETTRPSLMLPGRRVCKVVPNYPPAFEHTYVEGYLSVLQPRCVGLTVRGSGAFFDIVDVTWTEDDARCGSATRTATFGDGGEEQLEDVLPLCSLWSRAAMEEGEGAGPGVSVQYGARETDIFDMVYFDGQRFLDC